MAMKDPYPAISYQPEEPAYTFEIQVMVNDTMVALCRATAQNYTQALAQVERSVHMLPAERTVPTFDLN